jgi:hypothetical protein
MYERIKSYQREALMHHKPCLNISPNDVPSNREVSFLIHRNIASFISSAGEKTICETHPLKEVSPSLRGDTRK